MGIATIDLLVSLAAGALGVIAAGLQLYDRRRGRRRE